MGKYSNQYSLYQTENNYGTAIALLYGFLGDAVSEEKKLSILKKLQIVSMFSFERYDDMKAIYPKECAKGGKFYDAIESAKKASMIPKDINGPAKGDWKAKNMFKFSNFEFTEPIYEEFHKGMGELIEVLEEHAKDMKIKEPNAENYYNFLYTLMKDAYEGTFDKKTEENAWYAEAVNMTAKMAFPFGCFVVNADTHKLEIGEMTGSPVEKVLKETAGLGFVEMIVGGTRIQQKTEECLKTGRVSRQDLLHEYEQQNERFEKLSKLSKEKEAELLKNNIIQNDLGEFTDGSRGVGIAVFETEGRCKALEMGYPVEDLPVISAFYAQMRSISSDIKYLQKGIDNEKDLETKFKLKDELSKLETSSRLMTDVWEKITENANPLTQHKRVNNFIRMQSAVEDMHKNGYAPGVFIDFEKRVAERKDARLTNSDDALLAGSFSEMLESLNAVDPGSLLTGSAQFNDFKKELERLVRHEKDIKEDDDLQGLDDDLHEVLQKAQIYLRYKDRQINGPKGKKHKRSELEKKRVQTVDAIYNRLKSELKTYVKNEDKIPDFELAVVADADESRLLEGPATDNTPSFENYMKLHTGKGSMSGTIEEMVDDMAKTLAAQTLQSQKPPREFNIKELHKYAETIKKKFDLKNLTDTEIRRALKTPSQVKEEAVNHYMYTYKVRPDDYAKYVDDMRALYANMKAPAANSTVYRAVFDAVKRAASLPKSLDDIDEKKLQHLTADINADLFSAIDKYVNKYAKKMGPNDAKVMHVLETLNRTASGAGYRISDIVTKIEKAAGIKDIDDPNHIELDDYGPDGKFKLAEKDPANALDPAIEADIIKKVEKTMTQTREDMKKTKETAGKQKKAKDVTETKKHKKLEEVNVKPMSRQV